MRSNFHFQGVEKPSSAAANIMEELRRTEQELQSKRRLMDQKILEEQHLKKQIFPRYEEDQRLKQQFYDLTPKSRQTPQQNDFFSKFSNNNGEQNKKQLYRNMLDQQVEHKRHESTEKQRREQLADEAWNNIMKSKPQVDTKSQIPVHNQSRVRESSLQSAANQTEAVRYPKPAKAPEMTGYSQQQQKLERLKQIKRKEYFKQLNQQIEEDKRRKQELKKIQKQAKMVAHESRFTSYSRKSEEKPQASRTEITSQPTKGNQNYEQEEKVLRQKYRKGLIDVEEFEKRLRLLEAQYGKRQERPKQVYQNPQVQTSNHSQTRIPTREEQKLQIPNLSKAVGNKVQNYDNSSRYNIGTSRHSYQESLMQQPTEYYPVYPQHPQHTHQPPQYSPHPNDQFQNKNPPAPIDPFQYASIMQQNQLQMFQKMMDGMKEIITTTLMYDRKKNENITQRPNLKTIQTQYKSIPRQIPAQLRSPNLTKIHSPSPRNMMEPSLSLQNIKIAYESIDQSKNFFKKLPKIKQFKKFDYVEKMGGSTLQIPSTSCFVNSIDGFQKLQKSFEKDLVLCKQAQLSQQIQNIKGDKPYFKKKQNPIEIETGNFKLLTEEKKQYDYKSREIIEENPIFENEQSKNTQYNQPSKWEKKQFKSSKDTSKADSSAKQQPYERQFKNLKRNSLEQQFSQRVEERVKLPTFLQLNDITQLRKQLQKENYEEQCEERPAIFERSTYEAKQPIVISNVPEQPVEPQKLLEVKKKIEYFQPSQIESEYKSQSELQQFLRPPASGSKKSNYYRVEQNNESSVNAESGYQQSFPKLDTNVLKLSRKKMSEIKKNKDNLLFDFMSLTESNQNDGYRFRNSYEEEVTEKIQEPSEIERTQRRQVPNSYSKFRESVQHEESQTILSKFEQSNLKDPSELNYSREPSSLTSLQEARKKAKEVRNRDKKQSSIISLNTIQQLERQIKRKEPQEEVVVVKAKQPPNLVRNPKELLGMLEDMVDQEEEYPAVFDSYRQQY